MGLPRSASIDRVNGQTLPAVYMCAVVEGQSEQVRTGPQESLGVVARSALAEITAGTLFAVQGRSAFN